MSLNAWEVSQDERDAVQLVSLLVRAINKFDADDRIKKRTERAEGWLTRYNAKHPTRTLRDSATLSDHTTTALGQIKADADRAGFERALNAAAAVGYCECAETRHVTLGDKVSQAITGIEYKPAALSADTPTK
jgi:hypothetical protein